MRLRILVVFANFFLVCLVSLDDSHELVQGSTHLDYFSLGYTTFSDFPWNRISVRVKDCSIKSQRNIYLFSQKT